MKFGYTVWTWLSDEHNRFRHAEDPKSAFEQALREISYLGYETVENFNWFADCYLDEPEALVDLCARYGMKFVNLYHYLTADYEDDREKAKVYSDFARKIGAPYMNLQINGWKTQPFERPTDREAIALAAKKATEIAGIAADNGVTLCVHPHANTPVFTEEQIAIFADMTDPAKVKFCLDTAHIRLSGGDPLRVFRDHYDRLAYVHFKDVDMDPSLTPDKPMKRFRALGQGEIGFGSIYHFLQEKGYDGIVCVELDYQKVCNFESAEYSMKYIRNVLGA